MNESTIRAFSALQERTSDPSTTDESGRATSGKRDADGETYLTLDEIARAANLSLDDCARELDLLAAIDAVETTDDDEIAYRPDDVTTGDVADRLTALRRVPDEHRDALFAHLRDGEIDGASLVGLVEALEFEGAAEELDVAASGLPLATRIVARFSGVLP